MDFFPSSVAFSIPLPDGSAFPIYWYGILIVLGALAGAYIASIEAKRVGMDPDHVWNALLAALILGVIGARLYHVISTPSGTSIGFDYYMQNPIEILNFRSGGLGIYGAVAGGILGLYVYARYAKINFLQLLDVSIPGLAIGQAIGRWGNYFNQELYGYPTDLAWGIKIDELHRLPIFGDLEKYPVATTLFHPTFLYESLLMIIITVALVLIARRWKNAKQGDMLLLWGMFYGFARFLTEFQRPDAWLISGVATAQIIGMIMVVVCGVMLIYRHTGPSKAEMAAQRARQRRRQQPR